MTTTAPAPSTPDPGPATSGSDRATATASSSTTARLRRFASDNGALLGLLVLCLALFIATPHFLTGPNLLNVGIQAAAIAVLAFGQTFVIVTAGIDLSVGSVAALSSMICCWMFVNTPLPGGIALVLGLAAGLLTGVVSGAAVAYGKLPAFIATLAMLSVARGLTLVISDGRPIDTPGAVSFLGGSLGPIPVPILVLIVAGVVCAFILNRTVMGRSMYAVGGNEEAARLAGLPVKRVLVTVYGLSGLYAALAGMLLAGRLNSANPQAASGYELDAIAAVVIGGASLAGGSGRASGTLVGALILAVIRNGLNILNVSSFWQQVVIGLVIAAAVGIDVLRHRRGS
ncbi:MAG: ABC transporter permease [Propionibacteriaceae bacterium]|jgi:ribose transport system permease protein|nr:ABC transporter permease [Propionibacteriaceae bacterium]